LDNGARERVDAALRWFDGNLRSNGGKEGESETGWADKLLFGGLPFSSQRVALFLRAVIKAPDLVILDEAFSGMDESVRDQCLLFLAHGETKSFFSSSSSNITQVPKVVESEVNRRGEAKIKDLSKEQALIVISYVKEEIPGSIHEWIFLLEANTRNPARCGRLEGPMEGDWKKGVKFGGCR
jgi:hypothetical protein